MGKMTKVLFINCVDPVTESDNRYPPLGVGYLMSALNQAFGPDRFRFDLVLDGKVEERIRSFAPDVVGIGSVSQNYNWAMEYASTAKRYGLPVIIGGVHVSLVPTSMTRDMDVACLGEAEGSIVDLMRAFLEKGHFDLDDLERIPGIAYWRNDNQEFTPSRDIIKPLDNVAMPDRSLLSIKRHAHMMSSRGCPLKCAFCSSSHYWDKSRHFSPERVCDEVGFLIERHGVNLITFYDDLFVASKKRMLELAEIIQKRGYHKRVKFSCSALAFMVNDEITEILKSMGMCYVALGLESGNDRVLRYYKGPTASVEKNSIAVKALNRRGIKVNATFIIGAPDETRAEIMDTYDFIRAHTFNFMSTFVVTPVPGTPLWKYALGRGLVSNDMDWSALNMNFEKMPEKAIVLSEHLSRQELRQLHLKFRRLRFWKNVKALPTNPMIVDLPRVASNYVRESVLRRLRSAREERV